MRRAILAIGWLIVLCLSALLPLSALVHGLVHVGRPVVSASPAKTPIIAIGVDVTLPHGTRSLVIDALGSVTVGGHVSDDVVTVGAPVFLLRGAHLDRDVVSLLGGIYRAQQVTVDGRLGGAIHRWNGASKPVSRGLLPFLVYTVRLGLAAGLALLLIGTCLTIIFPWQVVLISTTLSTSPLKSAVTGVLSLLTFLFLVVPLGLSLAGLPFALLLAGAAGLAWLFGMTAAALLLGRLIARKPVSLLWATAAGLIALAIGMTVPFAGPLLVLLLGLSGAGALAVALLTRGSPPIPVA